jgi:hypothetical protein
MTEGFRVEQRFNGKPLGAQGLDSMGRKKKAKNAQASLCEVVGHAWQETTSPKARMCEKCGLVKLLVKGHWRNTVTVAKDKRKRHLDALVDLWEGILE